jgi:branched-chain amino acid transport system ATP-binding protein
MLKVSDLHVAYGYLLALRGVSLEIAAGEIVCVIGPNGAGKTTLLTAIAGGVTPRRGSVSLEGAELVGMRPEQIARLGVAFIPEGRRIFTSLSVEENLRVGAHRLARREMEQDLKRILTHFPRLAERRAFPAGRLSGGEQQMLAIGRALMTRPRLVMVDEPSLGLAPQLVDQVYQILTDLRREQNLTMLINEQSSQRILQHADRIYVLRGGCIRLHDRAETLRRGDALMRAYFGFEEAGPATNAETVA